MAEREIPLAGGNVNPGVVRIGDTVRRTTSKTSSSVHQLLVHLEKKGFTGSPRFLGIDEKGREILSFVEGESGVPNYLWDEEKSVSAAAKLLRAYHDATLDFAQNDAQLWGITYPDTARHEVICHNDFAPYNFIFRDRAPVAVIDFDLVGPGPRLRDIAYAAYWLAPLSFADENMQAYTEREIKNGNPRLHLFCQTYGVQADLSLLEMVHEVLSFMGDETEVEKVLGREGMLKLAREGHLAHWQKEAQAFSENQRRVAANLTR